MSVPFNEAIESLQSIFKDFDKDIIELVLRENKGHMEKTLDVLLEMNGEKPINDNVNPDQDLAQIKQDEVLAQMLQNNLFLNEIRNDQDFASLFKQQQLQQLQQTPPPLPNILSSSSPTIIPQQPPPPYPGRFSTPKEEMDFYLRQKQYKQQQQYQVRHDQLDRGDDESPLALLEEDFADIKEKINQLGEVAKNKFKVLADMFMKKQENQYQPLSVTDPSKSVEDEDDEIIVYDRNISRRKGNINSTYEPNEEEEEEYDSFILDNSNSDKNIMKLRSYKDEIQSKKDQ